MFTMDIVIPYVVSNDAIWIEQYNRYKNCCNISAFNNMQRFRQYDNLRYVLRSIEKNMTFVDKVFLVLQGPSQIPNWLDTNNPKIRIVYHYNYIHQQFLPTFNSNTIECFLWRIPELSEYFIYTNDDLFAMKPLKLTDFFAKGKIKKNIYFGTVCLHRPHTILWANCIKFGMLKTHRRYRHRYVSTEHGMGVKCKSHMKYLFDYWGNKLYDTFTMFRDFRNVTQYMFDVYEYENDNIVPFDIKNQYTTISKLAKNPLAYEDADVLCINDTETTTDDDIAITNSFLESKFKDKCSFEK